MILISPGIRHRNYSTKANARLGKRKLLSSQNIPATPLYVEFALGNHGGITQDGIDGKLARIHHRSLLRIMSSTLAEVGSGQGAHAHRAEHVRRT